MDTRDSHIFFNNLKGGLPVAERAEGIYLFDRDGQRYIDGIGGMFVVTIGHAVAEIAEAMAEQAKRLTFEETGKALRDAPPATGHDATDQGSR